jgi:hypothetical protein
MVPRKPIVQRHHHVLVPQESGPAHLLSRTLAPPGLIVQGVIAADMDINLCAIPRQARGGGRTPRLAGAGRHRAGSAGLVSCVPAGGGGRAARLDGGGLPTFSPGT